MNRFFPRRFLLSCLLAVAGQAADLAHGQSAASAAATKFNSARLKDALVRDLSAHYRTEGDLQLELVRPWMAPDDSAAAWDVVVSDYPSVLASTLIVRCRVMADGVVATDETLLLRATLWRDAWFTSQPQTAGSSFDPDALQQRKVDCLRDRDALPATAGNRSFIFSRDVGPDRMVTWRDIARRPLVRKGEVVEVVASEGPLVVTLKAMALQNGGEGDLVTVRNLESLKELSALVVADDRVRIEF